MVGLVPIPVMLVMTNLSGPPGAFFPVGLILCVFCSLAGGIGCLGRMKSAVGRVMLGLLLGVVFFILSCVIALFAACAHINI